MTEEEYRTEMAKQARLANLIAMRVVCRDSAVFASKVDTRSLDDEIVQLAYVA